MLEDYIIMTYRTGKYSCIDILIEALTLSEIKLTSAGGRKNANK